MIKEMYPCVGLKWNNNMKCTECYAPGNLIFYFDRHGIVHIGDTVCLEKDEKNNIVNLYINGSLRLGNVNEK
jgi:hypothetical protein